MKKISLLAASVALALVGCGGSDGDSSTSTPSAGGIVITGFDGYFKNAVVFLDSNQGTPGTLDASDTVLGLTDTKGQIKLPKDTDRSTGTIALQTLKPGAMTGEFNSQNLAQRLANAENKFASDYSDTYTTDMDLPGQPMEHSVVFRSQQVGDNIVISPITDLVALQPATVYSTEKSAEQKVCDSLFGDNAVTGEECTTKLYSDFTKSDPVLHKTAQILTETKATAVGDNYIDKINTIAKVAMETATEIENDEDQTKLTDPTYKPVIDTTVANDEIVKPTDTTYKTLVNEAKYNEIQNSLDKLNLEQATSPKETELLSISVADLFSDKDINGAKILVVTDTNTTPKGMTFEIINNELVISGAATEAGSFSLVLQPKADQSDVDSTVSARFSFDVKAAADAVKPTLDKEEIENLQSSISGLKLVVGQSSNLTLSADGFFDLPESETIKAIELSSNTSSIGLSVKLTNTEDSYTFSISGRPTSTAKAGEYFIQLRATADNGLSSEVVKLDLPAIVEAIAINDHEVKLLQDKINNLELTVGEPLSIPNIDIKPLFTSNLEAIDGYFAGGSGSNSDGQTTIAGITVSEVDEPNGLFKIEGTPTSATKNGYFYVAAGINADAEDGTAIHSEYVKITLPDVKPAEEVIPPTDTKLEDITWYVAEYGTVDGFDSNTGHDQIWCESIKFNNGKVFTNTRSATNLKSCSEANVEWDGATYTVSNAGKTIDVSLPTEKNGEVQIETMRYALTQTEDNISNGSATVYTQEINASDEITYSQRYTFFSEKTDLEARLNIQSNSGWEGRVFPMYLPSASGPKLGTVTLSLEENTNSNDDGSFDADVTFDLPGESITCEMVRDVFRSFTFSNGRDITQTSNGNPFECYNGQDDGSEIQHATVDFDLPNLTVNDVYSILGKTTESGRSQVELIKFNIEWTGVGNNE